MLFHGNKIFLKKNNNRCSLKAAPGKDSVGVQKFRYFLFLT